MNAEPSPPNPATTSSSKVGPLQRGPRWWPAMVMVWLVAIAIVVIRSRDVLPHQQRNIQTVKAIFAGLVGLGLWWIAFSRVRWRWRFGVVAVVLLLGGVAATTLRITGVSGDLVPILEFRWAHRGVLNSHPAPGGIEESVTQTNAFTASSAGNSHTVNAASSDFPQFLGPNRNAMLSGVSLDADWKSHPPRVLWRQPIGAAWSGFVIVGDRALTQEQRGDLELVTCYQAWSGRLMWSRADAAHYNTTIAGEGPRCTPTVMGSRVFALGATGLLNCLDLATGRQIWQRTITADAGSHMPGWGFSGSPLVHGGRVYVSAGGKNNHSMLAYDAETGAVVWASGSDHAGYSSPFVTTLAGVPQILIFNAKGIASHEALTGAVLWEQPWGIDQPHVANPVVISSNQVLFSSGYGVGAALLEIRAPPDRSLTNRLSVRQVWRSIRMKAKFSNLVTRDGFLYGLDDGVLACVDLLDGSLRWKEGRYGHGQGLLVEDLYLLMGESGELVLLRPTPEAPHELGRFPVFRDKTWNPIALAGSLLLVRNDREAAAVELALRPGAGGAKTARPAEPKAGRAP